MPEAYYNYAPVKRCYSEIIYTVSVPYLSEVEQDGIVHPVVDVNIKFHVNALGAVLAIKNAFTNNTNMSEKYTDRPWKTLNYGSSYKRFYGLTGITFQVFGLNYYRLNDLQHDVDINIQERIGDQEIEWSPQFIKNVLDIPAHLRDYTINEYRI